MPAAHRLAVRRSAFFPRDGIVAIEGERSTYRRQADSGAWLAFHFCPECGSTVFWENERLPDIVSIAIGAFADPQFPPPVRTVFTRSKHDWLAFPDIPHHPESPATLVPRLVGSEASGPHHDLCWGAPLQWRGHPRLDEDARLAAPLPA